MTELQLDLKEIKQTLDDMKNNISKIENQLRDSYFENKIIEMQYGDDNFTKRQQIDREMESLLEIKHSCPNSKIVQDYCDRELKNLNEQYIELSLEEDKVFEGE